MQDIKIKYRIGQVAQAGAADPAALTDEFEVTVTQEQLKNAMGDDPADPMTPEIVEGVLLALVNDDFESRFEANVDEDELEVHVQAALNMLQATPA